MCRLIITFIFPQFSCCIVSALIRVYWQAMYAGSGGLHLSSVCETALSPLLHLKPWKATTTHLATCLWEFSSEERNISYNAKPQSHSPFWRHCGLLPTPGDYSLSGLESRRVNAQLHSCFIFLMNNLSYPPFAQNTYFPTRNTIFQPLADVHTHGLKFAVRWAHSHFKLNCYKSQLLRENWRMHILGYILYIRTAYKMKLI